MDQKTAERAMKALWWLIEKETCTERRRLHIARLLDVAPHALEQAPSSFDRDSVYEMIRKVGQAG